MRTSTRREFMHALSASAAFAPVMQPGRPRQPAVNGRRTFAYVGTYTSPQGPNHGQGIHILEMNPSTGALVPREIVKSPSNPAWLAFNRDRTRLYSANEVAAPDTGSGSVSAYAVDRTTGELTLLNTSTRKIAGRPT